MKEAIENFKNNAAVILYRSGLTPDLATAAGLFFAFVAGLLIYRGSLFAAACALVFSGALDLLDGAIARTSGRKSVFGGILDSSFDRYGDGFIFGGLVFYSAGRGETLYAVLAMSALLGSFAVSYVRARAECEIDACRVGFWERGERLVYVAIGLFVHNIGLVLWVLGVGTHLTALFRLAYSHSAWRPFLVPESGQTWFHKIFFHTGGRSTTAYYIKAGLLFMAAVWIRVGAL